jgi:hypothetical protein
MLMPLSGHSQAVAAWQKMPASTRMQDSPIGRGCCFTPLNGGGPGGVSVDWRALETDSADRPTAGGRSRQRVS